MSDLLTNVLEVKNGLSTSAFAREIGMQQKTVDLYLKGERKPSVEFVKSICTRFGVSADWLLGLDTGQRGGGVHVTANGPGAQAAGRDLTLSQPSQTSQTFQTSQTSQTSPSGDCSRCQLLADHIRRITGRA